MKKPQRLFRFEMNFFKTLYDISKSTSIYLQVPDTIISGYGFGGITLFSTNSITGELVIRKNLSAESVSECFAYFEECEREKMFPVAVFKIGVTTEKDHCKILFTAQECQQRWEETIVPGKVVQKYIRNGNVLSILRTSWSAIESQLLCTEIVKHKNIKIVNEEHRKSLMNVRRKPVLQEVSSKANRDIFQILENDLAYRASSSLVPQLDHKVTSLISKMENYFFRSNSLKILSFDSDWIRDSQGLYHLVSVKSYQICEISAFKSSLSLFQVPKVSLKDLILLKSRSSINLKKKLHDL